MINSNPILSGLGNSTTRTVSDSLQVSLSLELRRDPQLISLGLTLPNGLLLSLELYLPTASLVEYTQLTLLRHVCTKQVIVKLN